MTLQVTGFNVWALLVSVGSQMVIGWLWYSPLMFGTVWLRLIKKARSGDIDRAVAVRAMSLGIVPALLSVLSLAVILSCTHAATVADALLIGTLLSVGLIGMNYVNLYVFEERSWHLVLINTGHVLVALNTAAVILTAWK
jgi:hypothetical protein